jgi:hypothetical protein
MAGIRGRQRLAEPWPQKQQAPVSTLPASRASHFSPPRAGVHTGSRPQRLGFAFLHLHELHEQGDNDEHTFAW